MKDFRAIEEHVVGALHVATLDDHGAGAHFDQLARGGFHVREVFDGQPSENFSFGDVGGDDAGALQEFGGDGLDASGGGELRTAGGFHNRADYQSGELAGVE